MVGSWKSGLQLSERGLGPSGEMVLSLLLAVFGRVSGVTERVETIIVIIHIYIYIKYIYIYIYTHTAVLKTSDVSYLEGQWMTSYMHADETHRDGSLSVGAW